MEYPIDIERFIAEFESLYPDNEDGARIFRAILPMVNEAYQQGQKDVMEVNT